MNEFTFGIWGTEQGQKKDFQFIYDAKSQKVKNLDSKAWWSIPHLERSLAARDKHEQFCLDAGKEAYVSLYTLNKILRTALEYLDACQKIITTATRKKG